MFTQLVEIKFELEKNIILIVKYYHKFDWIFDKRNIEALGT